MPSLSSRKLFPASSVRSRHRPVRVFDKNARVVDTLTGEDHPVVNSHERLWDALLAGDLERLHNVLQTGAPLNALYQPDDLDRMVAGEEQASEGNWDHFGNEAYAMRQSPLSFALSQGRPDLVEALLDAGADVNAPTGFDFSLINHAITWADHATMDRLIERGARLDAIPGRKDGSSLSVAASYLNVRAARRLLDLGCDVNAPSHLPTVDAMRPCSFHRPLGLVLPKMDGDNATEMVDLLLAAGARLDDLDSQGNHALHLLVVTAPGPLQRLIALGAEVNARNLKGEVPLHTLKGLSHYDLHLSGSPLVQHVQALIDAGADVNALDNKGESPLTSMAAFHTMMEGLPVLLNAGADPYLKGNTPSARNAFDMLRLRLQSAVKAGHSESEAYFREFLRRIETFCLRSSLDQVPTMPALPSSSRRARL